MPPILFSEYRNQHSRRYYPFTDAATMKDSEGIDFPVDFLVDASLYPIDLAGSLYLSQIDVDEGKLYVSDTSTGDSVGYADFNASSDSAVVYETADSGRNIGVVIFGDGVSSIFSGQNRLFNVDAAPFAPAAYVPLNQEGVRGFVLDDGSIVTGDVTIEGQEGVDVSSSIDVDGNVLRIDVVGELKPIDPDCGSECPPLKTLCFDRQPGSLFTISEYTDSSISISGFGFTLEDICAPQKAQKLPDEDGKLPLRPGDGDDPCEPPPTPPPPPEPGPELLICYNIVELGGNFFIVAPSSGDSVNAVGVKELSHANMLAAARVSFPGALNNIHEAFDSVASFTNPARFTDGLALGFKGLAQYRRKNK